MTEFYQLLTGIHNLLPQGQKHVFPATLPKPLHREHCLPLPQGLPLGFFAATPKVDGYRVLVATNGAHVWTLDRTLKQSNLTGKPFPITDEVANLSVFDAERVFIENGRILLMLFDCLVFSGQTATNSPLYVRLALLREFCNQHKTLGARCPSLLPSWLYRPVAVEFPRGVVVTPKPFLPGAKIPTIHNLLSPTIPVDGWVFYCLNAAYTPTNTGNSCWKFKPPHQLTIDFRIVRVDETPKQAKLIDVGWLRKWAFPALEETEQCSTAALRSLQGVNWTTYSSPRPGANYFLVIDIGHQDIPKLFDNNELRTLKVQHILFASLVDERPWEGVVECRFDHNGWHVLHSREKKMSNRLLTVLDTVRAIENPLTETELFDSLRHYVPGNLRCW